ncbi:MAG: hypothetical protein D3923_16345, partial [Candidatus Electrothrix sp. AR3]|nr:hypothetical protein [Candidatus Electrothrix sp. AR3]
PAYADIDPITVQKILATDGINDDKFGHSVSVDGNIALIGAAGDDNGKGSAYVFVRSLDGTWTQQQKLNANDGAAHDAFGCSVSVSGNTAVIGAYGDDNDAGLYPIFNTGSAYVFVQSGKIWSQQAKLIFSDEPFGGDAFGWSVSVDRDTALIGAIWSNFDYSGSAYVFVRSGTGWSQQAKFTGDGPGDGFGWSVSLNGDTALVGAALRDDSDAGTAHIFVRSGTVWNKQAMLVATDIDDPVFPFDEDGYGRSVSVSGDTAVIGATGDYVGSAYIFLRSGTVWSQQAMLTASDRTEGDKFGTSVSVDGNTVVVGARGDGNTGLAYIFLRSGKVWSQQIKLTEEDGFGGAVFVDGDTVLIGARGNENSKGAAYAYSGQWKK